MNSNGEKPTWFGETVKPAAAVERELVFPKPIGALPTPVPSVHEVSWVMMTALEKRITTSGRKTITIGKIIARPVNIGAKYYILP